MTAAPAPAARAPSPEAEATPWRRRLVWPAAVALLTAALWLLYGPAHAGYDEIWALAWGNELGSGELPRLDASPAAPTPHPLANAVAAVLSPLGTGVAPSVFEVLVFASLAWLGITCLRLGSVFALPVGVAFAVVVLTRPRVIHQALIASTDVAFLALTLAAVLGVARAPDRGWAPLALLGAAGLLRPEAWALAVLYGVYLLAVARPAPRRAVAIGALAVLAPTLWVLSDLIITGDPLFSLRGTQELAVQLRRPRGLGLALVSLPDRLESVVGQPLLWLGLVGWVVALWAFFERALVPSAVITVGLGSYLLLGAADLPLLARYMLLPGVLLELFAALLLCGWAVVRPGRRLPWVAGAAVGALALASSLPANFARLDEEREESAASHAAQADLERLVSAPAARAVLEACPPVSVHDFRIRPFIWYWAGVPPAEVELGTVARRGAGTYVTPQAGRAVTALAARTTFHKERGVPPQLIESPAGSTLVAETPAWRMEIIGCDQAFRARPRAAS